MLRDHLRMEFRVMCSCLWDCSSFEQFCCPFVPLAVQKVFKVMCLLFLGWIVHMQCNTDLNQNYVSQVIAQFLCQGEWCAFLECNSLCCTYDHIEIIACKQGWERWNCFFFTTLKHQPTQSPDTLANSMHIVFLLDFFWTEAFHLKTCIFGKQSVRFDQSFNFAFLHSVKELCKSTFIYFTRDTYEQHFTPPDVIYFTGIIAWYVHIILLLTTFHRIHWFQFVQFHFACFHMVV